MNNFPHELCLGDVYISPLLLVVILAFIASALSAVVLNKFRLSRFLLYPSLSFISMMVLYLVLIDHFFIKI